MRATQTTRSKSVRQARYVHSRRPSPTPFAYFRLSIMLDDYIDDVHFHMMLIIRSSLPSYT